MTRELISVVKILVFIIIFYGKKMLFYLFQNNFLENSENWQYHLMVNKLVSWHVPIQYRIKAEIASRLAAHTTPMIGTRNPIIQFGCLHHNEVPRCASILLLIRSRKLIANLWVDVILIEVD